MNSVIKTIADSSKPVPCLFYPAVRAEGLDIRQILSDAPAQAELLKRIPASYPVGAVVRMTELWCEAAAFGVPCSFSNRDFPTLGQPLGEEAEELLELDIPDIDNEILTPLIEAARLAVGSLDVPLIVGMTGPYTLGSVLGGSEDFMMACMGEPDEINEFMDKLCVFLTAYAQAYKEAGAAGVMIAEPSTAMISPSMMEEFSTSILSRIIDAVQDDSFAVIYHNCGQATPHLKTISALSAAAFHFGSDIDLVRARSIIPGEQFLMGNLDPRTLLNSAPAEISRLTSDMCEKFRGVVNWIPSTGCDLSPSVKPEAVQAFLDAIS